MSVPRKPELAKLFTSVISISAPAIAAVLKEMAAYYGALDFVSELLAFDYTDYYHAEMGQPLCRRFASFAPLVEQEDLTAIKLETITLETGSAVAGKRTVNIDPGYLLASRVVLASTKNYAHRIYLSGGIYADLTLVYRNGEYRPLPWTYPDYAGARVRGWLRALRQKYLLQLRNQATSSNKDTKDGSSAKNAPDQSQ